jgi:hypothetical protein
VYVRIEVHGSIDKLPILAVTYETLCFPTHHMFGTFIIKILTEELCEIIYYEGTTLL